MKSTIMRIIFIALIIYVAYTFVSQQKLLNTYAKEAKDYEEQIEQANDTKAELTDKLDMYLPNEKVYIDIAK